MIRLLFGAVLVGVAGFGLAAEPAPSGAKTAAPLDLVLLGEGKISRVEVRVEVDGKPVAAIWDESFAKMFAFFDRNSDGSLDEKEAANLPSPLALRLSLGNGFTPPLGAAPALAALDANKDGKVNAEEHAAFYRKAGIGNVLVGVGRIPTSEELTDALLKNLDTDGNGKVSEKELKAAVASLMKLDKNDDELVGAGELVPKSLYPGAAGTLLLTAPTAEGGARITRETAAASAAFRHEGHELGNRDRASACEGFRRRANRCGTRRVAEATCRCRVGREAQREEASGQVHVHGWQRPHRRLGERRETSRGGCVGPQATHRAVRATG